MIIAIMSLLIVLFITLLITRLAAVALTLTGMSEETARFQARSALSGVGFPTREAELAVNHPVRRKIIMWLMLVGNIGVPTVVATTVVSVMAGMQTDNWWWPVLVFICGVIALILFGNSKIIAAYLNKFFSWGLNKWTDLQARDYNSLLNLQNGYAVTEMLVEKDDWIEGRTLQNAALAQEGILVLGIRDLEGAYLGTPRAKDTIKASDTLVLYGRIERLQELDRRRKETGDAAHMLAVSEHTAETMESPDDDSIVDNLLSKVAGGIFRKNNKRI